MKPDSAEKLDSLAGEYVLGTLSPEQYAAAAERLRTDPALRAAVDAWEARLLELTALSTPQPQAPACGAVSSAASTSCPHRARRLAGGNASACGKGSAPQGWLQACCWRLPC